MFKIFGCLSTCFRICLLVNMFVTCLRRFLSIVCCLISFLVFDEFCMSFVMANPVLRVVMGTL